MKKLKESLLMSIYLIVIPCIAICQPYKKGTFSLSLGGELLIAENTLRESHQTGPGATFKGEYVFGEHTSATFVSGYYFMQGKNTALLKYENISAVPIKTGLRYYFGSFYGIGEAGGIFFSGFNQGTSFVYSFGMGDKIKLSNRVIDIALRHEGWVVDGKSKGIIALRVGYEFAVNQRSNISRAMH